MINILMCGEFKWIKKKIDTVDGTVPEEGGLAISSKRNTSD